MERLRRIEKQTARARFTDGSLRFAGTNAKSCSTGLLRGKADAESFSGAPQSFRWDGTVGHGWSSYETALGYAHLAGVHLNGAAGRIELELYPSTVTKVAHPNVPTKARLLATQ